MADCELSLGPFPPRSLLPKTMKWKPLGFVTKYSSLPEKGDSVRIEMSAPDDVNRDFIPKTTSFDQGKTVDENNMNYRT